MCLIFTTPPITQDPAKGTVRRGGILRLFREQDPTCVWPAMVSARFALATPLHAPYVQLGITYTSRVASIHVRPTTSSTIPLAQVSVYHVLYTAYIPPSICTFPA